MITLQDPIDMHIHLREGEILKNILPFSAKYFSACLAMPNLKIPLTDTNKALDYKKEIQHNAQELNCDRFSPIMSIYLNESITKDELLKAKKADIRILKLYPKGATTGSENGLQEILNQKTLEIFEIAESLDFILSIHGESNGFSLDREFEFGEIFKQIAINFPKLKIIIEHLSDRRSIDLLHQYENIFATITLHHMIMSLDDVIGKGLNPHHFCKPILKTPKDRDAILELALSGDEKVSFGSDSAPHLQSNKLKQNGAAGIFSAPVLLPKLCEIFEKYNKLENLQKFISDNAINIYKLKNIPNKKITLIKEKYKVQDSIRIDNDFIVPFLANEELIWRIKD